MDEILSIIVCAVIGVLFTWISERGKRDRSRAEAAATQDHDDHRERVRRHAPPLPVTHAQQQTAPDIPEEGVRVTSDRPVEVSDQTLLPGSTRIKHDARNRWRQAIIDSEILTRKY